MALWATVEAGDMTAARFRSLGASLIAQANQAGVQLADIGLTTEAARQLGIPARPLGLRPTSVQVDRERIGAEIDRAIASDSPDANLRHLAASEARLTVATAVQSGMKSRGATGWTRGLSGLSCETCKDWADGVVRSPNVTMVRHNGCDCLQSPVF